jgi:long-chain acyl-CoA synthetase
MKHKKKKVFLTGATGLVGSYLLKILLQEGHKVYVLARSKDNKAARTRVTEVLKFWDKNVLSRKARNLVVLDGDITKKNLGLDKQKTDLLKNEVEEIYHCAAVTQFNWPLEEIRKVNVEGTKNILNLAVKCKKNGRLKKVNHLSTAYVCGDYEGIFREDDLDVGQGFNSTYEQSKFESEKLVEEYREKGLWIDTFRPPLVLGESTTGKTITFQQSIYQLLHIWSLEIFDSFPGKGIFINIVSLDDICLAIFKISSLTSLKNKNYHLFNYKVVPLKTILTMSSQFLGFRNPALGSRDDFFKSNPTSAQKMLLMNNILLFNNNVKLDSRKTNRILGKYKFKFSDLDGDFLITLLKYCIRRRFLKKRS